VKNEHAEAHLSGGEAGYKWICKWIIIISEYAARADVIFCSLFRRRNVGQNRRRRAVNEIRGKVLSGWVMIEERERRPHTADTLRVMNLYGNTPNYYVSDSSEFDPVIAETQSPRVQWAPLSFPALRRASAGRERQVTVSDAADE
jgi:hypothetical protein